MRNWRKPGWLREKGDCVSETKDGREYTIFSSSLQEQQVMAIGRYNETSAVSESGLRTGRAMALRHSVGKVPSIHMQLYRSMRRWSVKG